MCRRDAYNLKGVLKMGDAVKAFMIPHEAWYKSVVLGEPHIYIGFYCEGGGTDGEFKIEWNNIGIQLLAYNDSWNVLSQMPELIELMGRIDREELNPTISEFAEMLKELGYKDFTEREQPTAEPQGLIIASVDSEQFHSAISERKRERLVDGTTCVR